MALYSNRLKHLSTAVALTLASVLIHSPVTAQQASPVGVDAVRSEPLSQTVPVIGRLVALRSGDVSARIGGAVERVAVDVGDRVTAGDVVASLVRDTLEWKLKLSEADVTEQEAAFKTAKARRDLVAQELARLTSLKESAAFSKAQRDDKGQEVAEAESALAEAQAAIIRARAQVELDRIALYNTDIRAPFDGVVTTTLTEAGAYLQQGGVVLTLLDDSSLEVEAEVPALRIGGLKPGTPIQAKLEDGNGFRASVRAVVPDENPRTRTRTVRFAPLDADTLKGGAANQSVTVMVPAGSQRQVLSVHKDAVLNRKGQQIVYVVAEGEKGLAANPRPVQLGEAVGPRFEVVEGLEDGELVAVRGNERLRPGQSVAILEDPNKALAETEKAPSPAGEGEKARP
ncbi:MAG: efflux RND transporter periplasmic adaptor subunit [Rhodospirillales bacterium]